MPNQTQIECYFKSEDLIKLCQQGKDIVININASYPHGEKPVIKATANVHKKGVKNTDGTGTTGCPTPCR